jgi:hypothetical protein
MIDLAKKMILRNQGFHVENRKELRLIILTALHRTFLEVSASNYSNLANRDQLLMQGVFQHAHLLMGHFTLGNIN